MHDPLMERIFPDLFEHTNKGGTVSTYRNNDGSITALRRDNRGNYSLDNYSEVTRVAKMMQEIIDLAEAYDCDWNSAIGQTKANDQTSAPDFMSILTEADRICKMRLFISCNGGEVLEGIAKYFARCGRVEPDGNLQLNMALFEASRKACQTILGYVLLDAFNVQGIRRRLLVDNVEDGKLNISILGSKGHKRLVSVKFEYGNFVTKIH